MKHRILIILSLLLSIIVVTGCEDQKEEADNQTTQEAVAKEQESTKVETAQAEVFENDPTAMAQAVYDLYEDGLIRSTAVIQETGETEAQLEQMKSVRNELIDQLVAYGKVIQNYDEDQKTTFESELRLKISTIDAELFKSYQEKLQEIWDNDELRKTMRSFNIITQYSQFELLKQQEPEEAARLGIE